MLLPIMEDAMRNRAKAHKTKEAENTEKTVSKSLW